MKRIYTMVDADVVEQALDCARGCYQRDLLCNRATWSGAELPLSYKGRYKKSREHLIERLRKSGLSARRIEDNLGHGAICYRICRPEAVGQSEQNTNV